MRTQYTEHPPEKERVCVCATANVCANNDDDDDNSQQQLCWQLIDFIFLFFAVSVVVVVVVVEHCCLFAFSIFSFVVFLVFVLLLLLLRFLFPCALNVYSCLCIDDGLMLIRYLHRWRFPCIVPLHTQTDSPQWINERTSAVRACMQKKIQIELRTNTEQSMINNKTNEERRNVVTQFCDFNCYDLGKTRVRSSQRKWNLSISSGNVVETSE